MSDSEKKRETRYRMEEGEFCSTCLHRDCYCIERQDNGSWVSAPVPQEPTLNGRTYTEDVSHFQEKEGWEEDLRILGLMRLDTETHRLYDISKLTNFVRQTRLSAQLEAIDMIMEHAIEGTDAMASIVFATDIERIRKDIISDSK